MTFSCAKVKLSCKIEFVDLLTPGDLFRIMFFNSFIVSECIIKDKHFDRSFVSILSTWTKILAFDLPLPKDFKSINMAKPFQLQRATNNFPLTTITAAIFWWYFDMCWFTYNLFRLYCTFALQMLIYHINRADNRWFEGCSTSDKTACHPNNDSPNGTVDMIIAK